MERKTKIVCTIGPASESKETLIKLVKAGMNVCRLNFSHGTHEEHGDRVDTIRQVVKETNTPVAILLDTKGPEVRCGDFANGGEHYEKGDTVTLVRENIMGTKEKFHIQCPEIFDDVSEGGTILIDDGKISLTVTKKGNGELFCRVENPGMIKSKKGCNLPGVILNMPFISVKDDADIRFACKRGLDFVAASFTRRKEDVLAIRQILKEENAENIKIIVKIENQEGYENLRDILSEADGVMVARGDLGVDVSVELVPIYQKQIIKVANELGKPVITATHMLETMQQNPRPTRAEASDVANAVLDGTDAIMLSGETAAGAYPVESVMTMDKIAKAMEEILPYQDRFKKSMKTSKRTKQDAIAISATESSMAIDVAAIIAFTETGSTARRISKYRPKCPLIAVAFKEEVIRSLNVNWGVKTVFAEQVNALENEQQLVCDVAKKCGLKSGDTVIVVAGYPSGMGATNMMKIVDIQ